MGGYLLDTSALTPLVDQSHIKHTHAKVMISGLGAQPVYVSVIALAELNFGIKLYEEAKGRKLLNAERMINDAQQFPRLDVGRHTILEYAELKARVAVYFLPNVTRQFRKKYVEDWIDQFTAKPLRIDDNDLWICAQAREHNLTVIADDRMARLQSFVKLLDISPRGV